MKNNYAASWAYEHFISMALQASWGQHDFKNADMENLMDKEQGASWVSHLKVSKLLATVKNGMQQGITGALKRRISPDDRLALFKLHDQLDEAGDSLELLEICNQGMDVLRKYSIK